MAKRISARGVLVLSAVLLATFVASLVFAAPAAALPCVPFLCSQILDCGEDEFASCSDEGCICRRTCNRDSECDRDRICHNGLCIGRLPESCDDNSHCPPGQICAIASNTCFAPCNQRADCPTGQVCGNGRCGACAADRDCLSDESCNAGLCQARPVPPELAPECTSNRQCDDRYPCNGEEFCDGSVCRSGPRPCTAEPPMMSRCVVDPPGGGCFQCKLTALVDRPFEGEVVVEEEPVSLPPGVGPDRGGDRPGEGGLPPAGAGRGFSARGVLQAPLAAKPPLDLPSGRLRIVLADPQGLALFDQAVEPGQWEGDAERGYVYRGRSRNLRGVRIAPAGGKDAWRVEIDGVLSGAGTAKRFGRAVRPVLALSIEWKDAATTVAVAELADCSREATRERQTLRCRTKKSGD